MEKPDFLASERRKMVETQLRTRDIHDKRVLDAMRTIPRHSFVAEEYRHLAYTDGPLPIGSGQTISQPYIVALMSQLLMLKGDETVLEIGTGSGYQAAILSQLANRVHTIERHAELAKHAKSVLKNLGIDNVRVHVGDGTLGLPEDSPFAGIIVTAASPQVPSPLLQQLEEGGRMVIPVGGRGGQFLERWTCKRGQFVQESIIPVAFVPLMGEFGWKNQI